MSKAVYAGVDGIARKVKKMYIGVDGVARKVKKAYIGVGGVARQFYSADFLTYDGKYEVLQVEYEGKICDLYRLKKSGILTLNDDALFWMCGGGANGGSSSAADNHTMPTRGVGGGGGYITEGSITAGESWVVTVGAARGASSITDGTTTYRISGASGINGTSGGGGTHTGNGGTGTGKTTMPFGIASLGKHCAGGGSGETSLRYGSETTSIGVSKSTGYDGGSNGSDAPGTGGSKGGDKGGGNGGSARAPYDGYCSASKGGDATFYGSGGGGGGAYADEVKNTKAAMSGGSGYQGVVYILDVNGGKLKGIIITRQPEDVTATLGAMAAFTVEASGDGLTYQWEYSGDNAETWWPSPLATATSSSLEVEATLGRQGMMYRCKISSSSGAVTYSNTATLTVITG